VGRPDQERDIPDDSDNSLEAAPGSEGRDSDSMRALEKQIARFEQSTLSEIRALQSKIDQLAAVTISERIAALEEKITVTVDRLAEITSQRENQAMRVQTLANPLIEARDDQKENAFEQYVETGRPFETVSPSLISDRSQAVIEPATPILTAAEPNTLLKSYNAESGGSQEQKKQLQQRISADIERVRAELRKRAGVAR